MTSENFLDGAAHCRELALSTEDPTVALAYLELADEFEETSLRDGATTARSDTGLRLADVQSRLRVSRRESSAIPIRSADCMGSAD